MLNQMCHEVLSNPDVNAIRKERAFTNKETNSRSQFESFFLSSIGLEAAMSALTTEEIACLHLLNRQTREVDLTFFKRLYSNDQDENRYYHATFTQLYKDTFKGLKQNLLRRGLLLMAELRTRSDNTKMERWRFRFPPQFAPYLPPLIPEPFYFDSSGVDRSAEVQRKKVLEALDQRPTKTGPRQSFKCVASGGDMLLGKYLFSVHGLVQWQQAAWQAALDVQMPNDGGVSLSPVEAVRTILGTIPPHGWASQDQLEAAFTVLCHGVRAPSLDIICKQGWQWGGLRQHKEGRNIYYRLPDALQQPSEPLEYDRYLKPDPHSDAFHVDLHTIPFDDLETLNDLARLEITNKQLAAAPDAVKLGRTPPDVRESPLGLWLSTQNKGFSQVFEQVKDHWGKTIVHADLLVARVKDLSLRVQLERHLGKELILLSDEFIAFPHAALGEVEKIIQKEKFVVKKVKA